MPAKSPAAALRRRPPRAKRAHPVVSEPPTDAGPAAPSRLPAAQAIETAELLEAIGRNVRAARAARGLTLTALAERTDLSPSMLSLLERGRTAPSIGTMVALAFALDVPMGELMDERGAGCDPGPLTRAADRPAYQTAQGASRRVLRRDRARGVEIALDEYLPGAANSPSPLRHDGHEYGIAIEGALEVTVSGETYRLGEGDIVSYPSSEPHRIANPGGKRARAIWVNLRKP